MRSAQLVLAVTAVALLAMPACGGTEDLGVGVGAAGWYVVVALAVAGIVGIIGGWTGRGRRLRLSALAHDGLIGLLADLGRSANAGAGRLELTHVFEGGLRRLFGARAAGVYVFVGDGQTLEPASQSDLAVRVASWLRRTGVDVPDTWVRVRLSGSDWYSRVLEGDVPVRSSSFDGVLAMARAFEGSERFGRVLPAALWSQGLLCVMSAPLRSAGVSLGVVDVGREAPFSDADAGRFQFACEEFGLLWSRIEAVERVAASEALHRALMEATPDVVFVLDEELRIAVTNRAAVGFAGSSSSELEGRSLSALFGGIAPGLERQARDVLLGGGVATSVERVTRAGSEVWFQTTLMPLSDVGAGVVMGVARDVTASKHYERLLLENAADAERYSKQDALTGLENRRSFEGALDGAVLRAQRGVPAALLFVDLDGFKRCNDEFGHAFGDDVLVRIAEILASEVRGVDVVARIGGDEFCMLLDGTTLAGGQLVAERVRERVQGLGQQVGVSLDASVGLVEVMSGVDARSLLAEADRRMYEHKRRRDDEHGGT